MTLTKINKSDLFDAQYTDSFSSFIKSKTTADINAGINFEIANSFLLRVELARLAYRSYSSCGYIERNSKGSNLIKEWDFRPDTACLSALSFGCHKSVGTLSLVVDHAEKPLPMDELFHEELDVLRSNGRRLLEATRYSIDPIVRNQKTVISRLMQLTFIYAHECAKVTDIVIEVNPRHVLFYKKKLLFEVIGDEKVCPLVNGAPAVPMRVKIEDYLKAIRQIKGGLGDSEIKRSLFSQFKMKEEKEEMAQYLKTTKPGLSRVDLIKLRRVM